ncbi:helicase-exonuclease AddAB subunit AddA [Paenibacillus tarimensis]|uniref:helicase-exonuclease AddAB subunit AddA n=1 Tax=Paenibacillus tarimensis TaxID=416012 RepID=UPI001F441B02|nr:helicase-exonuclease AddAB subunit AddA [Paenibacillus tarimensis]MCF2942049.1 helicase-exonuclease AddAB subunit AddA [Paenibacillus tarimensis]
MTTSTNRAVAGLIPSKPEGSSWTDDQWRAVVTGGRNVLVAAAAGSGKTAVLVERIIRKISADTDVDRLLVATFTKAAASEMKERIRIALEKALDSQPESEHMRRQLALMNRAAITTLHSFCQDVIRRFYPLIGLDPGFRIANETEAELLRMEVLDELFEAKYEGAADNGAFLRLADAFGGERGDEPLVRLVQQLYDFSRSHPWPEHWLQQSAASFRVEDADSLETSVWVDCLKSDLLMSLEGAAALLEQALSAAKKAGGPAAYVPTFEEDLAMVRELLDVVMDEGWTVWHDRFRGAEFGRLKAVRGSDLDKELQERVKKLREQAKSIVTDLADELFGRAPEAFADELRRLAPQMEALAQLVMEFSERYEAAKRRRGLLDFGDLEHYCLRILRHPDSTPEQAIPSPAALEYQQQFDEILLDEYQDTNMVQEAIVSLIARPGLGNRFMVGDVKQSIYRFRLAEPNLFLAKYKSFVSLSDVSSDVISDGASAGISDRISDEFPDTQQAVSAASAVSGSDSSQGLRIDLARNFRSRPQVVDGVNDVFRAIMHESVAEMDYDKSAELVCGAPYPEPAPEEAPAYEVECVIIDRGRPLDGEEQGETSAGEEEPSDRVAAEAVADMQTAQLEARWIASRIRRLMDGDPAAGEPPLRVYDGKQGVHRKLQWRDIVILLRATRSWAPVLVEELQAQGIPAYAELSSGYFEATEVEIMISLLRVIDNPYQDIPLAGTLRSPLFGLTAEELARIRIHAGKGPYYEAVRRAVEQSLLPGETDHKLTLFMERLAIWRNEARQGSLADLLWRIYRETGFFDLVGGLPGGQQRQANLRALLDRARQYEATSFRGLFRFLRFIDRMRDSGGDLGTARALGEQEDVVRIMSIHKSKGLEFPVVFAAGLGKMFNMQDLNGSFLLHKQLGFGPKFIDTDLRISYPTLPHMAVKRRMRMETLAEEMRVLYVAMTRPKEKMILLGSVADSAKAMERWQGVAAGAEDGRLPSHELSAARRYLDWIMPLAAAHGIPSADSELAADEAGGSVKVKGWRIGIAPAAVFGLEAAAAAEEPDGIEVSRMEERLAALRTAGLVESSAAAALVEERLSWRYAYESAATIAAKTSVTELKRLTAEAQHAADAEILEPLPEGKLLPDSQRSAELPTQAGSFRLRRPRFMESRTLTAAERGTVSHLVMQVLPLEGPKDADTIRTLVEDMVRRQLLRPAQAEAVDANTIAAFYASELGQRMVKASWIKRELPFSCTVPAKVVHPVILDSKSAEEPVFIQGVVDCLFEDERGLVLLDYKTDRIVNGDYEQAAERHRFQMELYAEAVGRILGKKVTERHVFFFDGGESVQLPGQ